ncbi:MAG: hypothetical protein NZ822_02130 [Patescibacteria group bacterium]|nr:hypothetical protein [Patescibacteria group bacterium]
MTKSHLLAFLTMLVLIFIWWFSGGSVAGQLPSSPAEQTALFVWQNFNNGLAIIFNGFANFLR